MQLLISVVNEEEAKSAVLGGADIVDVKNPREGALGANFPRVIRGIRQTTPASIPVSAAIGDAPNKPGATALAALGAAVLKVQYVKVGLYGTQTSEQAIYLLSEVCRAVREYDRNIEIIAVAYADAHLIGSLPPLLLPGVTAAARANGCLLDTAIKGQGSLFTHLDDDQLRSFIQDSREKGLVCALAGSLAEADVPRLSRLNPDIIGFRTAACLGDRINGLVNASQVERLKALATSNGCPG